MTTAVPATALAAIQPAFTDAERLALAGFLAGYRGLTREAFRRSTTRRPSHYGEWAAVFWADASPQGYPAACPGAG
jgi:hypothetical protein